MYWCSPPVSHRNIDCHTCIECHLENEYNEEVNRQVQNWGRGETVRFFRTTVPPGTPKALPWVGFELQSNPRQRRGLSGDG
jgi:hypothetical protein